MNIVKKKNSLYFILWKHPLGINIRVFQKQKIVNRILDKMITDVVRSLTWSFLNLKTIF